tara:strand:- start:221 stop:610 length:390 start_codon:yes stop_codon:yes gene_type:complete
MLSEMGNFKGRDRITFTGLLNYFDYRLLLWRSNLHCYFTKPYVTSWSLFESATCGAKIMLNKNKATKDIVDEETVTWTELDNQNQLATSVKKELNSMNPKKCRILPGFELSVSMEKWEKLLNKAIQIHS